MIRLRVIQAAFASVGLTLAGYVLLLTRGPLLPVYANTAVLVVLALATTLLLQWCWWQSERLERDRERAAERDRERAAETTAPMAIRQARETWYNGKTRAQPPVTARSTVLYRPRTPLPPEPVLRQPGERPEFQIPGADMKARIVDQLDRGDERPWGDVKRGEDTGEVTKN